ncbi:MAG: terpene cyclase/mutase family protein [Planctomycetota bacterium]|nr:terpene cyclase/mutase family protein [Planctomycetota bacterium]
MVKPLALILGVLVLNSGVIAQETTPPSTPPDQEDSILGQPDQPLDSRIDPSKITNLDLPPLPEQVVLPMPPWFALSRTPTEVPIDEDSWQQAMDAIQKGVEFLRSQQADNGSWMGQAMAAPSDAPEKPSPIAVAITALAMKAIAQSQEHDKDDPTLQMAANYIRRAQLDNGSFEGGALGNYVTSCVVMALASHDEFAFDTEIHHATQWLKQSQWDQSEGVGTRQDWFGGAGYGNRGRPDLSNTQFMLDALYDAHLSPDEPSVQRALMFVSRTQNLKETNNASWATNDGGFIYTPANGGESMASEVAGEGRYGENIPAGHARSLRSYGSMTYAGFKSMIFAGLSQNDIRVRAAFDWIRRNWTFDENPGLGQQGLYYYYSTMARTLTIAQQHHITDIEGVKHNWREELIAKLLSNQREDGSWINEADRWMEGDPVLCTTYSLLALEEAMKPILKLEEEE